jgi:hypothetical protein
VSVHRSGKTPSNRSSESKTYCAKKAQLKTLRSRAALAKQSKHDAVSWFHHRAGIAVIPAYPGRNTGHASQPVEGGDMFLIGSNSNIPLGLTI